MIQIRLFGPVEVSIDGAPAPAELLWRKHLALLVYLVRSPRLERSRDHLISLLWAEKPEDAARHSLNEAVRILRRYAQSDVDRQQQRVQLAVGSVTVDVDEFERALAAGDHGAAAQMVAGEFMEGFSVADAWEFEDWLARERNHWRDQSMVAFVALGRELLARGDVRGALRVCERALALDGANEEVARIKLNAHAILGDRVGALRYYDEFLAHAADLGVEPDARTIALIERIRAERVWLHPGDGALAPNARRPPLTGMDAELSKLVGLWHTCSRESRCGLAVIEGDAGTGKTRLLDEIMVRARLDGGQVMGVRAVEPDRSTPFATVLALAQAVADAGTVSDQPIEQLQHVLKRAVHAQPLLVCVDDAQWIDQESARALPVLMRNLARERTMFVLTLLPHASASELDDMRAHIDRDFAGVAVKTRLLDAEELRALARTSLPDYDELQIERVSRRVSADSAGIPFLAVELLYAIANGLDLAGTHSAWPEPFRTFEQTLPGGLPDAIVSAIRVGFRKLSQDAQTVAAAAAALHPRATVETLALATGFENQRLFHALDELEWQRWLHSDQRGYSFVARIARDIVVQDMLTDGQRQRIVGLLTSSPA